MKITSSVRQVPGLAVRVKSCKRLRDADPDSGDEDAVKVILAQHMARRKKEQEHHH